MASNGQLPASDLAPIYLGQLAKGPAAGWNAMNVEARKRGVELYPTGSKSSYRTYEQQQELYQVYLDGGNLAAVPGTSNHGWGTAVDVATTAMREVIDQIGDHFGWSKAWSDAPGEWWHICYQVGHYSGPDPGPEGDQSAGAPETPESQADVASVVSASGVLHTFVEAQDGSLWYTYQRPEETGWKGGSPGQAVAGLVRFAPAPGKE